MGADEEQSRHTYVCINCRCTYLIDGSIVCALSSVAAKRGRSVWIEAMEAFHHASSKIVATSSFIFLQTLPMRITTHGSSDITAAAQHRRVLPVPDTGSDTTYSQSSHAEPLFPAASASEPSMHPCLRVRPAATSTVNFLSDSSLWLFFSCLRSLRLMAAIHDSNSRDWQASLWRCQHFFCCSCCWFRASS